MPTASIMMGSDIRTTLRGLIQSIQEALHVSGERGLWRTVFQILSDETHRDLEARLFTIQRLVERLDESADGADGRVRGELRRSLRELRRILDPSNEEGIVKQWEVSFTRFLPFRFSKRSVDALDDYTDDLRSLERELLDPDQDGAPPVEYVLPGQGARIENNYKGYDRSGIEDYRGRLNLMREELEAWSRKESRGGRTNLAYAISASVKPHRLPPADHENDTKEIASLHEWHTKTVKKVLYQLSWTPSRREERTVLDTLDVVKRASTLHLGKRAGALYLCDFLEATFSGFDPKLKRTTLRSPRSVSGRLIVPDIRSRFTGSVPAVERKGSEHPLIGVALKEGKYERKVGVKALWSLFELGNGGRKEKLIRITLILQGAIAGKRGHKILDDNRTELQSRLGDLCGMERGADNVAWPALAGSLRHANLEQIRQATYRLRAELKKQLKIEFCFDEEIERRYEFSTAGREQVFVETERIYVVDPDGREATIADPQGSISSGPPPKELFAHLESLPNRMRDLREKLSCLLEEKTWWQLRNREYDAELFENMSGFVNGGDGILETEPLDGPIWKQWEKWLYQFKTLFNEQVGDEVFGFDSRNRIEAKGRVIWRWTPEPYDQACGLHRSVFWVSREGVKETWGESTVYRARGAALEPYLLAQLIPDEHDNAETDFRSTGPRNRIGRELLQRISRGTSLSAEQQDVVSLLGARLSPQVGDPHHDRTPCKVVRAEFSEIPLHHCVEIIQPTLSFEDGTYLTSLDDGSPVVAKVVISKGPKPAILDALEKLASRGLFDSAELSEFSKSCWPSTLKSRRKLVGLGMATLNEVVAKASVPFEVVEQLVSGLGALDAHVVPDPKPDGDYDWAEIKTTCARRAKEHDGENAIRSWKDVFERDVPQEDSDSKKGDIVRVERFACVWQGALFGPRVAWIESLGAKTVQLRLVLQGRQLLQTHDAYRFLPIGRSKIHDELTDELQEVGLACNSGDLEATERANRRLFEILSDVDRVSDVLPATASESVKNYQRACVEQLKKDGLSCSPAWPLEELHDGKMESYLTAGKDDGIQNVLARRLGSSRGGGLVMIATPRGPATAETWRLIQDLYEALREIHRDSIGEFQKFYKTRERYLEHHVLKRLARLIQVAESMGSDRLEHRDPVTLRGAIDALEEHLEAKEGLRRIHLGQGTPFQAEHNKGYVVERVHVPGMGGNFVVRIVEPAYENRETGSVQLRGRILVSVTR